MTDRQTTARPIRFVLVFIGFLFFANPYFASLDVLPDFVGCVLIYFGMTRVARVNRAMNEARDAFGKLFVYCLIKDVISLSVFMLTQGAERPTAILCVTFANAIGSSYLTYRALYAFYDAIYGLAIKNDCNALYAERGRRRSLTESTMRSLVVFVLLREVLCVLPELSALSMTNYTDSGLIHLYDYIGLLRGFSVFIASLLGLWYLFLVCRYFIVLWKQREFRLWLGEAEHRFSLENPGFHIVRKTGVAFFMIGAGGFFLCDFYVDMQNLIPDWIGVLLMLAGVVVLCLSLPRKTFGESAVLSPCIHVFCVLPVYCGASLVSSHFTKYFHVNHGPVEISKTVEANNAYFRMWLSSLIEFFVFLGLLIALLLLLRDVIKKWAGYDALHKDADFEKRRRKAYLSEFDDDLLRLFIFGFVSGLFSFLYDYIQVIPDNRIFRILEFLWGIDLSFGLLFAVMFAVALSNIHREIRYRFYMGA